MRIAERIIWVAITGVSVICLLLAIDDAHATADDFYGPYRIDVQRVIDGDTVEADVYIWPDQTVRTRIRLQHVDTPEKRSKLTCERELAKYATIYTKFFLQDATEVIVTDVELGSFAGRVLGDVIVDGRSLSQALLKSGHARAYKRNDKTVWCVENVD